MILWRKKSACIYQVSLGGVVRECNLTTEVLAPQGNPVLVRDHICVHIKL